PVAPPEPPPAPPAPFAFTGVDGAANGGSPWPSELRTSISADDPGLGRLGPEPPEPVRPEPARPEPGEGAVDGIIEPGSRPSEWGKPVFDPDEEPDQAHTRFGGR
ncbi:MAG TPA: hypothetical protein VF743_12120, partial [Acidimicrobiales bacterium]